MLHRRAILWVGIGVVLLVVSILLVGGCTFSSIVRSHAASASTLQKWVESQIFIPIILWPVPEGSSLWLPPRYIDGPDYVELFYAGAFVEAGVEPPMYMLYESDSKLPIGQSMLTDYAVSDAMVISSYINLTMNGKSVLTEIRENSTLPDSGVAIFELGGTHVVYHWRRMPSTAALDVLEHRTLQVREDDYDIISAFDRMLMNKFQ